MNYSTDRHRVGRAIADITGEPSGAGLPGTGALDSTSAGVRIRLRSRAFVFADPITDRRVLLIVNDLSLTGSGLSREVLRRLATRFDGAYTEANVLITATHTHCGPGGAARHRSTDGITPSTFAAIVDGIVEAVEQAHEDVAPATLRLSRGELRTATVNRSRAAFDRNPQEDRDFFPEAIDPQTTLLRIDRGEQPVGAINWFAAHPAQATGPSTLIGSGANGYAAYHWERVVEGVDYLADPDPDFVAAFAQTNAADMYPVSDTPADEFDAARVQGARQYEAAAALADAYMPRMAGDIDFRHVYIDLSAATAAAEFTGDGHEHPTGPPALGAAAFTGGSFRGAMGWASFQEDRNPFWDWISRNVRYRFSQKLGDAHAPKTIAAAGKMFARYAPFVPNVVPVQLIRIGELYLLGIPGEVTITAGLRLRRTVAAVVGAEVGNVLVVGYANGHAQYFTTPEEYDAQRLEGASTVFGRWQLPVVAQAAAQLATAMHKGESVPPGAAAPAAPADPPEQPTTAKTTPPPDFPPAGHQFGDVITQPAAAYRPGEPVLVEFAGAHPNNDSHRGGTYLMVQRQDAGRWRIVADDGDWATTFAWSRGAASSSTVTIRWDSPSDAEPGTYRIRYFGNARSHLGKPTSFAGTSAEFRIQGK
ncbi:neutral/alkaline ceramidase [Nocardia sp. NEAU-G5]|uniref:Neutral ceramidase n=1 Tax=Nocardia albiluteola TaxID=2842303 RepID=A0ABS6BAE8_9NOCA|nr:neutral/alkaline non-lysosomal ceramidase N-terminal domain-containing protein [Nocardia albiluteola]MBU3066721.1 neutral/alkaline ceramidase [Nocardia albiluteola]